MVGDGGAAAPADMVDSYEILRIKSTRNRTTDGSVMQKLRAEKSVWTTSRMEIRFSAWLESLRKDVECTFGILKGQWRVLKTGV